MSLNINILRRYGIVIITVLLFVFLAFTTRGFLTTSNIRNLFDQQATLLIAAAFVTIAMIAGAFDVSIAAIFVAAPLFGLQVEHQTHNAILALLTAVGFGVLCGLLNGVIVTGLKVNSFIATLATSFMIFGSGYLISDRSVMRSVTDFYPKIARTRFLGLTTSTYIALAVVVLAWVLLSATKYGRHVYAVGGNPEAARLAGVPVSRVIIIAFTLAAGATALAGAVSASRSLSAQPSDDFSFVFGVISAVVVGGTSIAGGQGAVWRTVVGAFFIALMTNGFNLHQIDPIWQRIIQGGVILAAVAVDAWTQRNRA